MKILVGMSGGVDSTYAAFKLMREGHSVEGAVLTMHDYTEVDEARAAADCLGIPLHVIDAREAFDNVVIPNFIDEYLHGRTPNPCIVCNSEVKFRVLCDYARSHGFDRIATGHYARVVSMETSCGIRYAVARALDSKKDQTYMLWRLSQDILKDLVLPLGNMTKEAIREEALLMGFSSAKKKDSQEICFIPDNDYAAYIEARLGASEPGDFVDSDGNVIGKHKGIIHYTVGQRKGLGVALGARAFVTHIDPETNRITLSLEAKDAVSITVGGIVFSGIPEQCGGSELELDVKIRYQAPPVSCRVRLLGANSAQVEFAAPVRSATSGQSAVFYKEGVVAFGGFIR